MAIEAFDACPKRATHKRLREALRVMTITCLDADALTGKYVIWFVENESASLAIIKG